jgi:hypothetical protein
MPCIGADDVIGNGRDCTGVHTTVQHDEESERV